MLEGITTGFILSLSLYPGTVWLVKVGMAGRAGQVLAVALAFALSQLIWLAVAIPGLMMMVRHLYFLKAGMHVFGAFVLFYMSYKFMRSRPALALDDVRELAPAGELFTGALKRSFAMPMRLPAAMAILMSTGVFVTHPAVPASIPPVAVGSFLGVVWWWGQFGLLALLFARSVPQAITLKSLNKIRPFCVLIFLVLGGITLYFGLMA
ncbi:hypothetical protein [Coraliomargarita parva]|uniref:hypothetical protein n=1 Tax=Coraliomargarita parva TaxID=3014050 RepID=UPI0022B42BA4|nr:hypothetical protein [Coraliomargarita parva]